MSEPVDQETANSAEASIKVFVTSLSGNKEVKRKQQQVVQVLEVKRIPFEKKDIASNEDYRKEFRKLMTSLGDPNALPPQIFNGDRYIGGYDSFYQAVEEEKIKEFLQCV